MRPRRKHVPLADRRWWPVIIRGPKAAMVQVVVLPGGDIDAALLKAGVSR